MENEDTTDLLYSYPRHTRVENGVLRFSFEYDLNQAITQADLADMVLYCCQRDIRLQKILQEMKLNQKNAIADILTAANEYRKLLLSEPKDGF